VLTARERQEGFDVDDILAAVKEVAGVRDASLRSTPAGAHSLRLDLAEGADPAEVSRQVARLLQDRMGLDAAMKAGDTPPPGFVPKQSTPAGTARLPRADTLRDRPEAAGAATGVLDTLPEPEKIDRGARPLHPGERPGPRVVIDNVQVNTFGTDATVEVRLAVNGRIAAGEASGPAVDGYLLRLCATATAQAVDQLLADSEHADGPARCFVEHAAAVPFGPMQIAVVVLLLSCGGWVEQLAGSAVVVSDDRHAMVRATLAAVNRRLEALLS
jgi:hypothetical protein